MAKKKEEIFKPIISWAVIITIFFLLFKACSTSALESEKMGRANCPYKVEGDQNANLVIKYVDSPYCFWCWLEEPILERAVATKGNLFRLERYDIRYCKDIVTEYGFSGTPSFVFSLRNDSKEFAHSGFMQEEELNRVICGLSRGCIG